MKSPEQSGELEPPDAHHVQAAEGWLELGNTVEAAAELDQVSLRNARHPDVLEVRWALHATEKRWPDALTVAERLLEVAPSRASGWIDRSYALHELGRTGEAGSLLEPAADRFPKVSTIPYNLACYACQLGHLETAQIWLVKAARIAGKEAIQSMALRDPDLKPLRDYIRAL